MVQYANVQYANKLCSVIAQPIGILAHYPIGTLFNYFLIITDMPGRNPSTISMGRARTSKVFKSN